MARRDVVRHWAGAFALVGLLAMHGLAAHGTVAAVESAPGVAAVDHGQHVSGHSAGHSDHSDASGHAGHGAAALCLALLVGFALAALLRVGLRRGLTLRRVWRPVRWTPYHRASDPPDLSSLCVLRC